MLRLTLDGVFGQRARRRGVAAQAGVEETLLRSTVHPDRPIQHSTKDAESNPTGNLSSSTRSWSRLSRAVWSWSCQECQDRESQAPVVHSESKPSRELTTLHLNEPSLPHSLAETVRLEIGICLAAYPTSAVFN